MVSIVVDFGEWFNGIQGSGFKVQGGGGGFAASIWGDARRSYELTRSSYREPSPRGEGAPAPSH